MHCTVFSVFTIIRVLYRCQKLNHSLYLIITSPHLNLLFLITYLSVVNFYLHLDLGPSVPFHLVCLLSLFNLSLFWRRIFFSGGKELLNVRMKKWGRQWLNSKPRKLILIVCFCALLFSDQIDVLEGRRDY